MIDRLKLHLPFMIGWEITIENQRDDGRGTRISPALVFLQVDLFTWRMQSVDFLVPIGLYYIHAILFIILLLFIIHCSFFYMCGFGVFLLRTNAKKLNY